MPAQARPALACLTLLTASTAAAETTPNQFLARGTPTFVLGTRGDARADDVIARQVELVRGALFPDAAVVADRAIDVARGAAAWPERPVLYGGPHVHEVLAALAPSLPFELTAGRLVIGERVFEGDGIVLVAVVPARPADEAGPGYPELLLFAGTGTPGVAEINSGVRGDEAVVVRDAFGRLAGGSWRGLSPPARRIGWRVIERDGARYLLPDVLPLPADSAALVDACARGVRVARKKLGLGARPVSVYIYPDRGSLVSLSGRGGDGHAVAYARAVHVVGAIPPRALEALVAHEATHVLATDAWGPAGTPLLGEGLAVWVAGEYGGVSLESWRAKLAPGLSVDELLSRFRALPEAEAYPRAGLLVAAAVKKVGVRGVTRHLLGATRASWAEACKRAGLRPGDLEK